MGAFSELSKYFSKGIIAKAQEMGYSLDNICILQGNIAKLKSEFPEIYQNLQGCIHHRDRRTPIQYGQDLVASWLFEDCLVEALKDGGLDITLAGTDKNRKILSSSSVSANSDTIVSWNGKSVPLEIMSDYTGYWTKNRRIDLRDSKYQKLMQNDSLFLGFSTRDNMVILLNFVEPIAAEYTASHALYGGKPAYVVHIRPDDLKPFKLPLLIDAIKKSVACNES